MKPLELRCVLLSVLVLSVAALTTAQTPSAPSPPSQPPTSGAMMLEVRLKIVQELYGLSPEQLAALRSNLSGRLPAQQDYETRTSTTIRRLGYAKSMLMDAGGSADPRQSAKLASIEQQYHELVAKAPLSIAAIAREVETMLGEALAAPAREKIRTRFADRLKADEQVAPEHLDAILTGPLPAAKLPDFGKAATPAPAAPPPAPAQRTDETAPAVSSTPPGPQLTAQSRAEAIKPKAPPTPAPPDEEWVPTVNKFIADLAFTSDQRTIAQNILSSCAARVAAYRRAHAADFEAALKMEDASQKAETLRRLNEGIDFIYQELNQRVESLATAEQLQKVGKAKVPAGPPPAATAQPAENTPTPKEPAAHSLASREVTTGAQSPLQAVAAKPPQKPQTLLHETKPVEPLKPAPPEAEWKLYIETAARNYRFSDEQRQKAEAILTSCRTRAQAHRDQRRTDYESAEKLTDPGAKTEALKTLNGRLDTLYDELVKRVDSLASTEQARAQPTPAPGTPAKPATPGAPAAPGAAATPTAQPSPVAPSPASPASPASGTKEPAKDSPPKP